MLITHFERVGAVSSSSHFADFPRHRCSSMLLGIDNSRVLSARWLRLVTVLVHTPKGLGFARVPHAQLGTCIINSALSCCLIIFVCKAGERTQERKMSLHSDNQ